jgi:hypothetical protein
MGCRVGTERYVGWCARKRQHRDRKNNKVFKHIKKIQQNNLNNNKPYGNGKCAQTIREGLDKSGYKIDKTKHAKDYGPKLEKAGFKTIYRYENGNPKSSEYNPKRGDVAVLQPHKSQKMNQDGQKSGHMAIHDGKDWNSDLKQENGIYGSKLAKREDSDYAIYRNPNW